MNVASAYGANQSFQQALPAIASLYEAGGRLQQSGQQHAAGLAAQGQQAIAGLSLKHGEFVADQDQRAQRDLFESTREFEMQQQKTQLASWLNQQELSQKEQLRLQAMTAGVSDVLQNPDLSDSERVNLVTKLKTGIDVYKQRQEKALAKQEEAHAQAYTDQAARQTKIANANAALSSQTLEQRVNTVFDEGELQRIRDANPGADEKAVRAEALRRGAFSQVLHNGVDQYGNIKDHVLDGHGRGGKGGGKGGKAEAPTGDGGLNAEQYLKHYDRALEQVDKLIETNDRLREPDAKGNAKAGGDPNINWANRQKLLEERLKGMGLAGNLQDHLRKGGRGDDFGGGDFPAGKAEMKPFGPDKDANPDQLHQVSELARQRDVVEKLPIPPSLKGQFTAATYVMDAMLRKYGTLDQRSLSKMDDDDKKNYDWARKAIDQISATRFQGQQSPPPAAAPPSPPWIGGRFDGGKQ